LELNDIGGFSLNQDLLFSSHLGPFKMDSQIARIWVFIDYGQFGCDVLSQVALLEVYDGFLAVDIRF
jgi:hypothetical protein